MYDVRFLGLLSAETAQQLSEGNIVVPDFCSTAILDKCLALIFDSAAAKERSCEFEYHRNTCKKSVQTEIEILRYLKFKVEPHYVSKSDDKRYLSISW